MEHDTIRERTTLGRRQKAEQGKVVNPFLLPCWLRSDDGAATVRRDEHWAPIVQRVFRLYLEGKTLYGIKAMLEAEGVPAPGGGTT